MTDDNSYTYKLMLQIQSTNYLIESYNPENKFDLLKAYKNLLHVGQENTILDL